MHPFELLAHPVRRRIIEILASGEHTSGEVADSIAIEYGITASAVSKHLRLLEREGLLVCRADWVNRLYRLDDECIPMLRETVEHYARLWYNRSPVLALSLSWPMNRPGRKRLPPRSRGALKRAPIDIWRRPPDPDDDGRAA